MPLDRTTARISTYTAPTAPAPTPVYTAPIASSPTTAPIITQQPIVALSPTAPTSTTTFTQTSPFAPVMSGGGTAQFTQESPLAPIMNIQGGGSYEFTQQSPFTPAGDPASAPMFQQQQTPFGPYGSPYESPAFGVMSALTPREQLISMVDPKSAKILKQQAEKRLAQHAPERVPFETRLRWGHLPALRAQLLEAYRFGKPMSEVSALGALDLGSVDWKKVALIGGAAYLAWTLMKGKKRKRR